MTIVLRGKTKSPICGRLIADGDEVVGFPSFVANTRDPLIFFDDAAFHRECLESHPLAAQARARLADVQAHTGPGERKCAACGEEVTDVDDYLGFGHLTADRRKPLYPYNYTHLHKSHAAQWSEVPRVLGLLKKEAADGEWGGDALRRLVEELERSATVETRGG